MKKILTIILLTLLTTVGVSQKVDWKFNAVKKGGNSYQMTATATIPAGWHLYSTTTPEGGPVPTSFSYTKNPLIQFKGKVVENGKMQTTHDKNFGVDVKYYANKVVFTQEVVVKGKVKTNLNGKVEYMICNDHECLPPTSESINIQL